MLSRREIPERRRIRIVSISNEEIEAAKDRAERGESGGVVGDVTTVKRRRMRRAAPAEPRPAGARARVLSNCPEGHTALWKVLISGKV